MKEIILKHNGELVVDLKEFEKETKLKRKEIINRCGLQGGKDYNRYKDFDYLIASGVSKVIETMKEYISDDIMEILEQTFDNYYKNRLIALIDSQMGKDEQYRRLYLLAKHLFE